MQNFRRFRDPIVLLYNTVTFVLVILMVSNSERVEDVLLISAADASLATVLAGVGIVINAINVYLGWRDRQRLIDARSASRSQITGE